MTRNKGFFFVIPLAALFAALWSCNKNEGPQTTFGKIAGKWRLAETATDDNGNGVIDASELHPVQSGYVDILNFKVDSTGVETTVSNSDSAPPLNFTWNVIVGDSVRLDYTAHLTVTYYINNLNASNLTLTTRTPLNTGTILTQNSYNKD